METPDPATLRATCPVCGYQLWDNRKGEWTLVARVLRLTDAGRFEARCADCRTFVPVGFLALRAPDTVTDPVPAPATPGTRLVVRVDRFPRP